MDSVALLTVYFMLTETLRTHTKFSFLANNPCSSLRVLCGSRELTLLAVIFVFGTMPIGAYIQVRRGFLALHPPPEGLPACLSWT